jgi:glycosyltransferase involved in cell wall biosynthesis
MPATFMQTAYEIDTSSIKISAVIPTFNRQDLVERAVQSVLSQSFPPSEVIVVDDGSSDDTRAVLGKFGDRVRYVYQENAGCAVARDNGIRQATTDWVALLDSDDFWLEGHLQRMADAIAATRGVANYYFADTIRPPDRGGGSRWDAVGLTAKPPFELADDGSSWALIKPQPMMLQSSVFKRAAYLECGGFLPQLRFRDDTHLFLRLGLGQPICAVAGYGAEMTSDDDPSKRLTLSYNREKQERGHFMQAWMFTDLLEKMPDLSPATRSELQRRLGTVYRSLARDAWRQRKPFTTAYRLSKSYLAKFRRVV